MKKIKVDKKKVSQMIARHIVSLRENQKLSRRDLSKMSGVSYMTLGSIEKAQSSPSIAVLLKIAAAFKVPAGLLLGEKTWTQEEIRCFAKMEEVINDFIFAKANSIKGEKK